jgi:malic enzyme
MAKKDISQAALKLHKKLGGKIRIQPAAPVRNRAELSLIYTPGVGAVSSLLAENPGLAREYSIKKRMIAIVSDGSAVLGLGNIGPYGALPVMEGKAALFKSFAGVDAFPLVFNTQDPEEIIETVVRLAPAFGGVNLEDIAAPNCFYIEEELKKRLSIPVMHDDQHGTAIAVLAALLNAAKVVKKDFRKLKVAISGAGAAGTAIAKLFLQAGIADLRMLDSKGIIDASRTEPHKLELAKKTNPRKIRGGLREALSGADVFVGVSGPNLLGAQEIRLMAPRAIVFAMANPTPEIFPEEAVRGGAAVVATGRSDYPNQINNSLVFPGVFRGALERRVSKITDAMKLRAARNLAALVKRPSAKKIIPGPFERAVPLVVAKAIH